jgi:FkbM family methyltransferase
MGVRVAPDRQRARMPMPIVLEAAARVCFGYVRNQHGLRDRRPFGRFASRTIEFLLAGRSKSHVSAQMAGLNVLIPTADRTIARSVYSSGDWDPLLVGTAFEALHEYGHDHHGTTFLEVGANFGVYCLPAVSELGFARAIAYEPDPASFELLRVNIERNNLADRVEAHHAALSAQPGELMLSLGVGNSGDNRIVDSDSGSQLATVIVPARTFDDEVAAGRLSLDALGLVWLDVQGHEGEVLAGASSLLASKVPIVMEYSSGMLQREARAHLNQIIAGSFDVMVDLGWCSLSNRLRFQPASAIDDFARGPWEFETDLLLLHS